MIFLKACFFDIVAIYSWNYGIEPNKGLNPFLKTALNIFCMHKSFFLLTFFLSLSNLIHIGGYNRDKTRPWRP